MESWRIYKLQRFMGCAVKIVVMAALIALSTLATGAEPTPYRAVYKANYKGLPISATGVRELTKLPDGTYRLSSTAKSFLASIDEETLFRLEESAQVIPLRYQYHRKGVGRNRTAILTFDWEAMRVLNDVQDKPWQMKIEAGTQDKLSYQLAMQLALNAARHEPWPDMTYAIADGGQIKEYAFRVVGNETIDTPIGPVDTVKAVREQNPGRTTHFWLAPAYEFLLIRFEQVEDDGDGFTLMLKEAEFGGRSLR
jgi:hypothetical protein